jgi:aquaporin Z
MVYTIGPISGCHINPAVTLGVLLARKIGGKDAAMYVVAQCLGAIVGAGGVLTIARGGPLGYHAQASFLAANGYGLHSPAGYSMMAGFVAEAVLTFLLVLTVLGSTDVKAPVGFAGLAIGLVLVMIHLIGIPVTNVSVNPARSLGPAIFVRGWALHQLWLFIVAPALGGVVAALVYGMIRQPDTDLPLKKGERALPSQQEERRAS